MAMPKIEIAPELIAEGRRLYEETDTPIEDIAAHMQITRGTLINRIREWNWTRRRYTAAGLPAAAAPEAAQPETGCGDDAAAPAEPDLSFAERMQRVVDAQLAVIERTLKVLGPASSAEAERTARILAAISRTVHEIKALAEGRDASHETDNDPVPGDIDEFRIALAERIEAFVARRRAADDGRVPPDGSGAGVE